MSPACFLGCKCKSETRINQGCGWNCQPVKDGMRRVVAMVGSSVAPEHAERYNNTRLIESNVMSVSLACRIYRGHNELERVCL